MNKMKAGIIIALIAVTALVSYAIPQVKYKTMSIVPSLSIPLGMKEWRGRDISAQFNSADAKYNFIGQVFARDYQSYLGERLLFLILDAGNFHNPKVCVGSSGYDAKDLPDTELTTPLGKFKATSVYFEKKGEGLLIIYWICINKERVDWTKQKMLQLWYSMFNKKKVGVMVRFDVETDKAHVESSVRAVKDFVAQISAEMPRDQAEWVFGK